MKMVCKFLIATLLLQVFAHHFSLAQGPIDSPPRPDDVFWSRRVRIQIDLQEKINAPLLITDEPFLYPKDYSYAVPSQNIIRTLLEGYKALKFPGYKTDSLDVQLKFEAFAKEVLSIDQPVEGSQKAPDLSAEDDDGGYEEFSGDIVDSGDDFAIGDDFDFNDMELDFDEATAVEAPTPVSDSPFSPGRLSYEFLAPFETVMGIIEDWQFDKNKSSMYYDGKYIVLVWTDLQGQLGQKDMVAFNYEDVMPLLDETLIKNPQNDAEYRTAREVLELRRHNNFMTSVSGKVVFSMTETAYRKEKLLNFEHHLWEY